MYDVPVGEVHAFVTVWPFIIEGRLSTGRRVVELLQTHWTEKGRIAAFGRFFKVLIDEKVDTIQIRVENTDD